MLWQRSDTACEGGDWAVWSHPSLSLPSAPGGEGILVVSHTSLYRADLGLTCGGEFRICYLPGHVPIWEV